MAAAAGRNGRIYIDTSTAGASAAVPVSLRNSWSVDQPAESIDVTSFGDTNKQYVAGLPDATGAMDGFWDNTDTLVYNIIGSSVARKVYIYPDRLNTATVYFWTTAFFDVSASGDTTGAVMFNATWRAASPASWQHP